VVLCGHACVCVCVCMHTCMPLPPLPIADHLDAFKSCVCFSLSIRVKTNFEGWKYTKSFEVLCVQSFDTYPLCRPHFGT
jgi:hypothetical protein